MATLNIIQTGIESAVLELQPLFGTIDGAVLHMLPGGVENPEGFGASLKDVYAFTSLGKGTFRGGHYHLELQEMFFPVSGTALWVLSDFRPESPTYQKTIGLVLGFKALATPTTLPSHTVDQLSLPRVRVPAGVYHAIFPLTDERVMTIALGSTPFQKEDYRYPALEEIPGITKILNEAGLSLETYQRIQV